MNTIKKKRRSGKAVTPLPLSRRNTEEEPEPTLLKDAKPKAVHEPLPTPPGGPVPKSEILRRRNRKRKSGAER